MSEVPVVRKSNPRQYDLVTRSCILNPFLLREINDFCQLDSSQTRIAFNFLASFEKYIVSFHLFEYNKIEDKLIGCKALLSLWEAILNKFSFVKSTPSQIPLEKKGMDFIVALSNRMDLDIDPVWFRWSKSKKRSRLVQEFRSIHEQYMLLLTHSTRLALTKLQADEHLKDITTRKFIFRMLSIATLRLSCIANMLTEAFCSFKPRRLVQIRDRVGKASLPTSPHTNTNMESKTKSPSGKNKRMTQDTKKEELPRLLHAQGKRQFSKYASFSWLEDFIESLESRMSFQSNGITELGTYDNRTPVSQKEFKRRKDAIRGSMRSSIQCTSPTNVNTTISHSKKDETTPKRRSSHTLRMKLSPSVSAIHETLEDQLEITRTDYRIVMEHPELFGWDMFSEQTEIAGSDNFLDCVSLVDSKVFSIIKKRMATPEGDNDFFEFYAAYLYHIARRCYSEVWDRVPSFLSLSRCFFLRVVENRLEHSVNEQQNPSITDTQIINIGHTIRGGLHWAQAAIMLNPDPDGWYLSWMCFVLFKTTNSKDRFQIVKTWESVNEWTSTYLTAMRRMNRRPFLPMFLCSDVLFDAIKASLLDDHFNVIYSVLSFIYHHWYNTPERQLVNILNHLFSKEYFDRFFNHWCHVVRLMYHHILVYVLGCLRAAVTHLDTQAERLTLELVDASHDSELLEPEGTKSTCGSFLSFLACCGGQNNAKQNKKSNRSVYKVERSTTEISLCRASTTPHSDMLDNGLVLIGPLASLVSDEHHTAADNATLDLYHTDTNELLQRVDSYVKQAKTIMNDEKMSKKKEYCFEYEQIQDTFDKLQIENHTFIHSGQCVILGVVEMNPESKAEEIMEEKNKELEETRRKSFQRILDEEASLDDDDEDTTSSLASAFSHSHDEIAHARRYRDRMRHMNSSNNNSDDDEPQERIRHDVIHVGSPHPNLSLIMGLQDDEIEGFPENADFIQDKKHDSEEQDTFLKEDDTEISLEYT